MEESELVSRAEAKARGLKRYFTGKPCKHGHVADRHTHGGQCSVCQHTYDSRHRLRRNPQRDAALRAQTRSRALNIDCDVGHLATIECPKVCPVFGTEISFACMRGRRDQKNIASFDRKDPTVGYVPGNVQVLSMLANQMKSSATQSDMRSFAQWVLR